ncbi:predicted protein [Phaeodactylum tricornutum CCAP 1055/1]|jgi:hypothetical protein|uniref:Ankyrin repeat protein n=1 Tax=Phaeodactylum tricornutum (strain CCAP 1055/1) TaxID=556484 RepID=B7FPM8_PHATC|nr:predicted protein [Phaeodactylum tricornutum CCAP 1055/1]EEC51701.1 predicted protein [Phaeodactylum tricornutum CCAP 1055/1]|eukprot:XP_002177238.1 predicted protein [Phaeodactylum tricornutum CCAP 1055/1]
MAGDSEFDNGKQVSGRKRKADVLGRLGTAKGTTSMVLSKGGRGSVSGWTSCPLCGRHSVKKYALGRGIASHLHAVHTPWKPGKIERKKRRRLLERQLSERKREPSSNMSDICGRDSSEARNDVTWKPTHEEVEAWDLEVIRIIQNIDANALKGNMVSSKDLVPPGFDRKGQHVQNYRESLPKFLKAASEGNLVQLRKMVDCSSAQSGCELNAVLDTRDRHGSLAEHWAAGGGHLICLKYLFEERNRVRSASSETRTNLTLSTEKTRRRRDGKTCLHYAARNGHLNCIRFLVEQEGCKVDDTSGDGTSPLHLACFGGYLEVVKYLVEQGANVALENEWGCNASHWIAMTQNVSEEQVRALCRFLQSQNISFMQVQKQGHCALHKSAQRMNRHVIRWMLQLESEGGAGLSKDELKRAALPDVGGHTPVAIWQSVGGDEEFGKWFAAKIVSI